MKGNLPTLPYKETGGADVWRPFPDINRTSVGWPFAHLTLEPGVARLTIIWMTKTKYTFVPGDIQKLEYDGGILLTGVKIIHNREDYPIYFRFWSFRGTDFWKEMFNQAGFNLPVNTREETHNA